MPRHLKLVNPLPPEAVAQIWQEVLPGDMDQSTLQSVRSGAVRISEDLLKQFCKACIDFPHFATATDIANCLCVPVVRIAATVHNCKQEIRAARSF